MFLFFYSQVYTLIWMMIYGACAVPCRTPASTDRLHSDYRVCRTNYARFFLSLIAPGGKATDQFRRKFAHDFAYVDEEDYPIFQSVITGRVSLDDPASAEAPEGSGFSLLDMPPPDKKEMHQMRAATSVDGVVEQILKLLRTMPRRLLMILKLNDLTRSLDAALQTVSWSGKGRRIWS